ncbi:unnamed protein product, partial [marine sediment metagenome]
DIDRVVLLASNQGPAFNFSRTPNEFVSKIVKQHPDRFIGFGSTCSITKDGKFDRRSLDEVEKAVIDLGLEGIKLAIPYWGDYLPTDPKLYPLYAKIEELGVPILFHQSVVVIPKPFKYRPPIASMRNSMPIFLDDVAKDFPDLKMIIAHLGSPWVEETCTLMQKNPNIYADIASIAPSYSPQYMFRCLLTAKDYGVIDKVVYGSDGPNVGVSGGMINRYGKKGWHGRVGFSFKQYIDFIRVETNKYAEANGLIPLTETEIQNILGDTAAKLLGVKD